MEIFQYWLVARGRDRSTRNIATRFNIRTSCGVPNHTAVTRIITSMLKRHPLPDFSSFPRVQASPICFGYVRDLPDFPLERQLVMLRKAGIPRRRIIIGTSEMVVVSTGFDSERGQFSAEFSGGAELTRLIWLIDQTDTIAFVKWAVLNSQASSVSMLERLCKRRGISLNPIDDTNEGCVHLLSLIHREEYLRQMSEVRPRG